MKMIHNGLAARLRSFPVGGPALFFLKCRDCKYDFIGEKKQARCASCRAKNKG